MKPRATATATLLACALAAPACFDVHQVDPGPLVIDDFDDEDLIPALTTFESWRSYSFNPSSPDSHQLGLVAGNTSNPFALYVDFRVDDPPDGLQQHGGAALVSESQVAWDINRYRQLVFSAKLESGKPALPSDALLYVELGCRTATGEGGSHSGALYVVASVNHTSAWKEHRIDIMSFGTPSWIGGGVAGGPAQCRQRVDSIRFSVDAQLADGQSGRGVLTIDSITVE